MRQDGYQSRGIDRLGFSGFALTRRSKRGDPGAVNVVEYLHRCPVGARPLSGGRKRTCRRLRQYDIERVGGIGNGLTENLEGHRSDNDCRSSRIERTAQETRNYRSLDLPNAVVKELVQFK